MNDLFGADAAGTAATWVAAAVTIGAWSYLVGARRIFELLQLLLAGLATGYLVVLAVSEVLLPRLFVPLTTRPADGWLLGPALLLVGILVAGRWLPERVVSVPLALIVAGTAAFALAGAVVGTLLPQLAAALPPQGGAPLAVLDAVIAAAITGLVVLVFLHGISPRPRVTRAATLGRWLLVGGIGGWLGFLVVSRLALVVDRIQFLLGDWLMLFR